MKSRGEKIVATQSTPWEPALVPWGLLRVVMPVIVILRIGHTITIATRISPLCKHRLTGICAWISNHVKYFLWDAIAHSFPNFNGGLINRRWSSGWMSNHIPLLYMDVINDPYTRWWFSKYLCIQTQYIPWNIQTVTSSRLLHGQWGDRYDWTSVREITLEDIRKNILWVAIF